MSRDYANICNYRPILTVYSQYFSKKKFVNVHDRPTIIYHIPKFTKYCFDYKVSYKCSSNYWDIDITTFLLESLLSP